MRVQIYEHIVRREKERACFVNENVSILGMKKN